MDIIRLDYNIGECIYELLCKYRKKYNLKEPDKLKDIYNKKEKFLKSDIEKIKVTVIKDNIVFELDEFKGTKKVNNQEIENILNKLSNTKNLSIVDTDILSLDLTGFNNLESLYISKNHNLKEVKGLENLDNLVFFDFFANENYSDIDSLLNYVIKKDMEQKSNFCIDLLYYPKYREKYISDYDKNIFSSTVKFSELVGNNFARDNQINYSVYLMESIHNKAKSISDKYVKATDSDYQKFALLYKYVCDNINYDYKNLNIQEQSKNRKEYSEKVHGILGGMNGTYNAFHDGKVVCEGYTKMLQYLLKLNGIKSYDTLCCVIGNNNESKAPNHSIIETVIDGETLYSDATFDKNKNDKSKEYFLLTLKQMTDKGRYVYTSNNTNSCEISKSKKDELLMFAKNRLDREDFLENMKEELEKEIQSQFGVYLNLNDLDDLYKARKYIIRMTDGYSKYMEFWELQVHKIEMLEKNKKEQQKIDNKSKSMFQRLIERPKDSNDVAIAEAYINEVQEKTSKGDMYYSEEDKSIVDNSLENPEQRKIR